MASGLGPVGHRDRWRRQTLNTVHDLANRIRRIFGRFSTEQREDSSPNTAPVRYSPSPVHTPLASRIPSPVQTPAATRTPTPLPLPAPEYSPLVLGEVICRPKPKHPFVTKMDVGDLSNLNLPSVDELSEENIIQTVITNPKLAELYAKDTGVGDTVTEQTQNISSFAQKHRAALESKVAPLMTWKEFLLFVTLCKIGKGVAAEQQKEHELLPRQAKEVELSISREVTKEVAKQMRVCEKTAALYHMLLKRDLLGDYLNRVIDIDHVIYRLTEMSHETQASMEELFNLIVASFKVTTEADKGELFEEDSCEFSPPTASQVTVIAEKLALIKKGKEALYHLDPASIKAFRNNIHLSDLNHFIISKLKDNIAKLDDSESAETLLQQIDQSNLDSASIVRHLNLRDEDLLRIILSNAMPALAAYMSTQYQRCEMDLKNQRDIEAYRPEFELLEKCLELVHNKKFHKDPHDFTRENDFIGRGTDWYFVRDFFDVDSFPKYNNEALSACYTLIEAYFLFKQELAHAAKETLPYWRLRFHGTNSHVLTSLDLSGRALHASAALGAHKVSPFTGELKQGANVASGINLFAISCTNAVEAARAVGYASDEKFTLDLTKERETFEKTLTSMGKNAEKWTHALFWREGGAARDLVWVIPRLRLLDADYLEEHLEMFNTNWKKYKNAWDTYKTTDDYRRSLPKDDTNPGGWRDDYYQGHFKCVEFTITAVEESVQKVLVAPDTETLTTKPFPIVWGATYTSGMATANGHEFAWPISMKLGQDIDLAFTKEEHRQQLQEWLTERSIQITVQSFEELKAIQQAAIEGTTTFISNLKIEMSSKAQAAEAAA